jgi:ribosomal protein S12 methylthiotransferase accessory factor
MDMHIRLLGGKRVAAEYKGFTIATDQPAKAGGEGSAPAPFDLFLASMGTCAAFYVVDFCDARGIPSEGIAVVQRWKRDPDTRLITYIEQEIQLPDGFPSKYEKALVRAASLCTVKKHLETAPQFDIHVSHKGDREHSSQDAVGTP